MSLVSLNDDYVSRYRKVYDTIFSTELLESLHLSSPMQVPKIVKIVLNSCYSPSKSDFKKLQKIQQEMSLISGQRAVFTKAKRSLAGFHLREGMNLGVKVTLRKDVMYDFLDKLINIAMPRIKDFHAYDCDKNFDDFANFNFGLTDQTIFPEIEYDLVDFLWGMNVTIVTSTNKKDQTILLLEKFNFPFKKSKDVTNV